MGKKRTSWGMPMVIKGTDVFAGTEIYFVKKQESARVKKAKHTALITAFGTMKP